MGEMVQPGEMHRCPTCRGQVALDAKHQPFCSARCKDIDLGKWLQEEFVISRPMQPDEMFEAYAPEAPGEDGPS